MDISNLKIVDSDYAGKGVSVQSNPMELPEAEAKAVFDEISKDVIAPKINAILDAIAPLDIVSDVNKPISTATQDALNLKVDKALKTGSETEYKVLSDNNFDDTTKENAETSYTNNHTHTNKAFLDGFSQTVLDNALNLKVDKALKTGSETEYKVLSDNNFDDTTKGNVADNTTNRHNHTNKSILDGIAGTDLVSGGNVLTLDNITPYTPTSTYHPATVEYVNERVVTMGSADMTKAVYDPQEKNQDMFAYADTAATNAKELVDDTSGDVYVLGVVDGGLYYEMIREGASEDE